MIRPFASPEPGLGRPVLVDDLVDAGSDVHVGEEDIADADGDLASDGGTGNGGDGDVASEATASGDSGCGGGVAGASPEPLAALLMVRVAGWRRRRG